MTKCSKWLVAMFVVAAASCSRQDENLNLKKNTKNAEAEEAFIGQIGPIKEGKLYGIGINYMEIENQKVYEGDIILTEEQLSQRPTENQRTQGTGRTALTSRWTSNTVYYNIDPALTNQARVTDAIKHWEANSALRFVYRTNQSNYITFRPGSGCSSYVGMIGGRQYVTLATGCSTGSTIHEIGHAIGLWHEQSRADRGNYIRIHYGNIQAGHEHNFRTYVESGNDGFDHGSLDFASIMMYHPYSFSSNNLPTITRLDGSTYPTQRNGLSPGDIAIAKTMYPSGSTISTTYEAENYAFMSGVIREACSEGGMNVGSFDAGDWTSYNISIPTTGTYRISYRVASIYTGRSLRIERNNGTIQVGSIGIPNTGGWQSWTSVSHSVTLPAGNYSIGIATSTGGFNINRFHITNNF